MRWAFAAIEGLDLIGSDLIISHNENVPVEINRRVDLTESMNKIPSEGVVIVNEQYHAASVVALVSTLWEIKLHDNCGWKDGVGQTQAENREILVIP